MERQSALVILCGLQFRISAISLPKISESDIKSLIQESETQ